MKLNLSQICIILPALLAAPSAYAQSCTLNISVLNFGKVDILHWLGPQGVADVNIECNGIANEPIALCLSIGEGSGGSAFNGNTRTMMNAKSQEKMHYQLMDHPTNGNLWGSYYWAHNFSPPYWKEVIGKNGRLSLQKKIHGKVVGLNDIIASGYYSSDFAGDAILEAHYLNGTTDCGGGREATATARFTIDARIEDECLIETTPLNFGTASVLSSVQPAAKGKLMIKCTKGTIYSILLDEGLHSLDSTTRRMAKDSDYITYDLYADETYSKRWGSSLGTIPDAVVGRTGLGTEETYTVYGRVLEMHNPPPGTYRDTVKVTVLY